MLICNKQTRILLLLLTIASAIPEPSRASMLTLELTIADRSSVVLRGIVSYGDLDFSLSGGDITDPFNQASNTSSVALAPNAGGLLFGGRYADSGYAFPCPSDDMICAVPQRVTAASSVLGPEAIEHCSTVNPEIAKNLWVQYANSVTGRRLTLQSGNTPKPPSTVQQASFACYTTNLRWDGRPLRLRQNVLSPSSITVVDPSNAPPNASLCTIASIPAITFVANTFEVTGTRKTETLHVQCSDGVPQNYTIRLLATSTSGSSGRLLFTSGVSAQISLNGQNLDANGEKHVFPNLTTTDILLAAELVGSSSDFGVSSAQGVIILEIQ